MDAGKPESDNTVVLLTTISGDTISGKALLLSRSTATSIEGSGSL
jgi:hypothetical protein